ncbi:MAG TPA: AEC family transporter [Lachnospiraceae bacterium]
MDVWVVFGQMVLIFLMISIGYGMTKIKILSQEGIKQISWLVLNITNPCLVLSSAFEGKSEISHKEVFVMFLASGFVYLLLALLGKFTGKLVGGKLEDYNAYRAITAFANVGFIGIPLVAAVFGSQYLLYVAIFNIWFGLTFYTYGMFLLKSENEKGGFAWKKFLNAGTVSSFFAIFLFLLGVKLPSICMDFLAYVGKPTTFLSMLVLGYSIGQKMLKELLPRMENFKFLLWKMLFLPILLAIISGVFMKGYPQIRNILVVMVAMPAANMPLMVMQEQGRESKVLTTNIIMTTLMALVTIPIVVAFL